MGRWQLISQWCFSSPHALRVLIRGSFAISHEIHGRSHEIIMDPMENPWQIIVIPMENHRESEKTSWQNPWENPKTSQDISHDGSMVLPYPYMVTWIPSIYLSHYHIWHTWIPRHLETCPRFFTVYDTKSLRPSPTLEDTEFPWIRRLDAFLAKWKDSVWLWNVLVT